MSRKQRMLDEMNYRNGTYLPFENTPFIDWMSDGELMVVLADINDRLGIDNEVVFGRLRGCVMYGAEEKT